MTVGSSPLTRGKRAQAQQEHLHERLIPAHAGKTAGASGRPWRSAAHPRSRGENLVAVGGEQLAVGSSPLTRGKRNREQGTGKPTRLIPAHAGKTGPCR